ncbi:MAG: 4Fe-4S dicluster domain-containing protein [Desulfitobacteriaceae bacterium]
MSIRIDQDLCLNCGLCALVCPGGLIAQDEGKKAFIKYPKDCWGCAACLKECKAGAIRYFLGADLGGNSAYMYTRDEQDFLHWFIVSNGSRHKLTINKRESNRY